MVVLSTKPLLVVFNRGYTILDRFNNSISFTDASISHDDLFNFLEKDKKITKIRFNIIFDEIKQASSLLLELSYKKFLKDPRYFQIFAMDFVLDSRMTPWLVDVKGAPDYTLKNEKFVSNVLDLVHEMNQNRAQRMMNLINNTKHEVHQQIKEKTLKAKYWKEFMPKMKALVTQKMKNIGDTMTNKLPSKKQLKELDMEILFNENRKGKAKGNIPEFCL